MLEVQVLLLPDFYYNSQFCHDPIRCYSFGHSVPLGYRARCVGLIKLSEIDRASLGNYYSTTAGASLSSAPRALLLDDPKTILSGIFNTFS
jgi:hypothetical protein